MKINQGKALAVLLVLLAIVSTSSLSNGSGKAMRNRSETLVDGPLYLPVVFKKYPLQTVFGISLNRLDSASGLDQVIQAGASWTRTGFIWSAIEPSPGERLWDTDLEQGLIRATKAGVQPIMLIEGTPGWALKAGFDCGAVAENQFPALAQFAYDLVKRYSASPYNVRYWELWNEPDAAGILGCWGDPSAPYYGGSYYGEMLKAVYPEIKRADPNAQVLVGGLLLDCDPNIKPGGRSCVESTFLNGIMESSAGPYFDGVSFHAYDFYTGTSTYENTNWKSSSSTTGPVSIAKAKYLKDVLSTYGYGQKYLVNTESAVFKGENVMEPPCNPDYNDLMPSIEETKVDYVVQSNAVAVAEGWKANIWYSAFGVRCSGLLNSDLSPKPAYYAFQFVQHELREAVFVRQITEYPQLMGYEYEIPGRKLWVIWAMDGQAHTIPLPVLPLEINKMGADGQPVNEAISPNMTIDQYPRFIEFEE